MPSFLNRYYGIAPDQAGLKAAIVILLGAVVWGILADRAGREQPRRVKQPRPQFREGRRTVWATARSCKVGPNSWVLRSRGH